MMDACDTEEASPSTEPAIFTPTEAVTEDALEPPTEPALIETPTEPALIETPTEPALETPMEPALEMPTEPALETPLEPALKTPTEPQQNEDAVDPIGTAPIIEEKEDEEASVEEDDEEEHSLRTPTFEDFQVKDEVEEVTENEEERERRIGKIKEGLRRRREDWARLSPLEKRRITAEGKFKYQWIESRAWVEGRVGLLLIPELNSIQQRWIDRSKRKGGALTTEEMDVEERLWMVAQKEKRRRYMEEYPEKEAARTREIAAFGGCALYDAAVQRCQRFRAEH
jgi:hypothetical protein